MVAIVEDHGQARLLVDETYRELSYGERAAGGGLIVASGR